MSKPRLHPAPLAIASDGTVLLSVELELTEPDLKKLIPENLRGRVFVGLAVAPEEAALVATRLGHAAAEAAALLQAARKSRRRRTRAAKPARRKVRAKATRATPAGRRGSER